MSETILIASNSHDSSTHAVAEELQRNGYDPLVYESDKVTDGSVQLRMAIGGIAAGVYVEYDGRAINLPEVGAAWYRRPNFFTGELSDKGFQLSIAAEYRSMQQSLWNMVPRSAWLNDPEANRRAENKMTQLATAQSLGFSIPQTVVDNRWEGITDDLPQDKVFKTAYSILYEEDQLKMLYAKVFSGSDKLPLQSNPYPGLWQARVGKAREWRITVVGDEFFDAAIYTDETAKDDWRKHQATDAVTFRAEAFPDDQKERCRDYLEAYGLRYGAFDFIEDSDGKITFLECNPNGQYGWLEAQLGLPISQALANELITIAKHR